MPCFYPLRGYKSKALTENKKQSIVFNQSQGWQDQKISVPCGRCIGCRLEKSRQWALRITHEASLYDHNCFITLTYDTKNNPVSLNTQDFQKFMKRLREWPTSKEDKQKYPQYVNNKIRFYHAGEYGSQLKRPHHHACLFNFDLPDKQLIQKTKIASHYSSEILDRIWGYGYTQVGDLTFESAAYVARYTLKKINGNQAEQHYQGLKPEYSTMSRKPGIGHTWLETNLNDVYPNDYVVTRKGVQCKPTKYYDNILDKLKPEQFNIIKQKRKKLSEKNEHNRDHRLHVRAQVKQAQISILERTI